MSIPLAQTKNAPIEDFLAKIGFKICALLAAVLLFRYADATAGGAV